MNHLESSFTGRNNLWRYVVMFASVLLASNSIGALPLLVAYIIKTAGNPEIVSKIATSPNDISVLGLDPNIGLFMMLFPFCVGLVTFVLLIKPLNGRRLISVVNGNDKFRWNRYFIAFVFWIILSAAYLFIYIKYDPANFILNNNSNTLVALVLISVAFIPFQAAFEEILFRGYLMQGFAVLTRNRWFPLIMTSLLFGLMHAFNPEVTEFGFFTMMPQYVGFGLIFGIVAILDDGIETAIGAHSANNIFLCIMVTHKSSALQTAALYEQRNVYPFTEFIALVITGIIFVVFLKLIFQWEKFSLIFGKVEAKSPDVQRPYTDVLASPR